MLKLFQLRDDFVATLMLYVITLLISVSIISMLAFLKTETHLSITENFMVEINSKLNQNKKENVIELLKANAIIDDNSISYKSNRNAFDHFSIAVTGNLRDKLIERIGIPDVILFSTNEFTELRVRDEFMNAVKNIEGITSIRNVGTFKSGDAFISKTQLQILPLAIVLCVICLLFSFAVIRSELKRKYSEMKMLAFSGVNDGLILSRLRASVSFAALKSWFIAVLLIFLAFYLLIYNNIRVVSYIGIKDIIVALSISLVLLLIALPMYTNRKAKKILNKF